MSVVRCPECGNRLKTSYCPMCMKRVIVGLPGQKKETPWQERKYQSAYEDDHECIEFDQPERQKKKPQIPNVIRTIGDAAQQRRQMKNNKKQVTVVAVLVAVFSLISSLFGLVESVMEDTAQPEYNQEAFVEAQMDSVPEIEAKQIYCDNGITVTVDGAGTYYGDYTILVTVANDTTQSVTVRTELLRINGYMQPYNGLFAQSDGEDVVQHYWILPQYDLENAGIQEIATLDFCLDIYESEDYTQIDRTELITLETDIADSYTQEVDDDGWELYNRDGVRLLAKGLELAYDDDAVLTLYLENNTDQTVLLSDSNINVNDQESSAMLYTTMLPQSRAVEQIYFYDLADLDIHEIEDIQQITIDLHIEYMEDVTLRSWDVERTENAQLGFAPAGESGN